MIMRKWTGRIRSSDLTDYLAYVEATGTAHYAATPGNLGYQVVTRELGDGTCEFSTISWWADLDAVKAFTGEDYHRASYYPEDDRFLLDRPELVEHHQVLADRRSGR